MGKLSTLVDQFSFFSLLSPQTDKASLLAKAVEHVRDLKQRIAEISQAQLFPTETDEISVLPGSLHPTSSISSSDGCQMSVFEASVCCEDRSDLLPELIETLRSLRMKTLRAEIATLGGRVRNVLVLAREKDKKYGEGMGDGSDEDGGVLIKEALMSVVNRSTSAVDQSKRRRVVDNTDMND
ncbi:transcription factor bHLH106-like [Phalaenopsis equestris]|uniref:transcription factor bHLH106-like n=1 Tax=Phalaenopsis equestris TaxID=78828 RepID=UPI0009E22A81|nr:transcription factor bHLH106-like [Phalaenopsis equestris]